MKTKNLLLTFIIFLLGIEATSQSRNSRTLEIRSYETFFVGPENELDLDTLIMHNNSILRFDPAKPGKLVARLAIIGRKCKITAKGADGEEGNNFTPGEDGRNGGTLDVFLNFKSLGWLIIDIRGGDGGNGANGISGLKGKPSKTETRSYIDAKGKLQTTTIVQLGDPGSDGTDATRGGSGGSGGQLKLTYDSKLFTPTFNQSKKKAQSVNILYAGGVKGKDGTPGKGGMGSKDGTVKYTPTQASNTGHIEIKRADVTSK
ncbi:hypothetical protein [Pontibacter pudoricolor]|uniref:hypothetical protein n=1 Tax=Pontibacter pudoricolor TaxID=2694930 RepID=UPI001392015D|nr:hypothetical protein [Pontibacter pudoricolor]